MLYAITMVANFLAKPLAKENKDKGATAIEYGLLAALIAVMIVAGATAVGLALDALFQNDIVPAL